MPMQCELCNLTKPKGVHIQDIRMCNTCALKLVDADELDVRDFADATKIGDW